MYEDSSKSLVKANQAIGDAANWKRHQRLDEILIFSFTRTTWEKSGNLFSKKLCHALRPRNLTQSCLRSIPLL